MLTQSLIVGLFITMLSVPARAQTQGSTPSITSADRAAVKSNVQELAQSLAPGRKLPYFGTTGACDGSADGDGTTGNLTSGTLSPATWPSFTATMGVAVKMNVKDKIQSKSTIQCSTDADTSIASTIAIVDKNSNVFFADPDPSGVSYFVCSPGNNWQQHTGVWWFDGSSNPGFAGGVTAIIRADANYPNSGAFISFRSLCVDKVK